MTLAKNAFQLNVQILPFQNLQFIEFLMLVYSTIAITTHFFVYTLIDTGKHNSSLS